MEIGANATLHVALKDIGIDTMMPENTVDAVAFWIIIGIFSVIFGNLIYESYISQLVKTPKCPAPCCEEE